MKTAEMLAAQIEGAAAARVILAGKLPQVQGAILGELVSLWLAGHPPSLRDDVFAMWLVMVQNMIPVSEAEIFLERPRPEGWT